MSVYRDHTVGVVVPAYNEAGFVGEVIETVPDYVDRVYVVDDGSTDETWPEIRAAARRVNEASTTPVECEFERRVVPIEHERNRGVGGAIKTGYEHAIADRIDVTAVMGGDGQMRPDQLSQFLDPIVEGEAEYTKGDRLGDNSTREGMPGFRLVGNVLLSWLTKVASGYWDVNDPQNGYTAISLSALETVDIDEMYEFYGYCNDLLVRLSVHDCRVVDVPRHANYADEESHIEYRTYIPRVSAMLLRDFLWRLREQYLRDAFRPAGLSYAVGLVTGLTGVVLSVTEAVSQGTRSRGVGNGLRTALVGGIIFLLGTVLERERPPKAASEDDERRLTDTRTSLPRKSNAESNGDGPHDPRDTDTAAPIQEDGSGQSK